MKEEIYSIFQNSETRKIITLKICGITHPAKNYVIRRNNSETCCIEYVESGTGTVHLDDITFHPAGGDSYMLQQNHDQYYYSNKQEPWKKYFINIEGNLVAKLISAYDLENHAHFPGLDIKTELTEIIGLAESETTDNTHKIIGILNRIFFKMRASLQGELDVPDIAVQMKDFLNTRLHSSFKIEELCREFSHSESQTIRIFKNAFGVTPYSYVLNKKISIAKQMLRDTALPIKEIAKNLNFADEYYFSNVFKSKTGCSPSHFRKAEN